MGQIQSGVNSVIGGVALLSGLAAHSPAAKRMMDYRNVTSREAAVAEKLASIDAANDPKAHQELAEELVQIKKDKFNLRPSRESYEEYRAARVENAGREVTENFGTSSPRQEAESNLDRLLRQTMQGAQNDIAMEQVRMATEQSQNSMEAAMQQKRNRVPIYGARGEVINGQK